MSPRPDLGADSVLQTGAPLHHARRTAVLVHGRDQDEQLMLDVADRLALDDVAYLLPVAAERSWYDGRYFDPIDTNQPQLDHALATIERAITVATQSGAPGQVVLGGFSQGACLVAHMIAQRPRPRPLAGLAILTGALLGPRGQQSTPHDLFALPVYASCSVHDAWIVIDDARATAEAFAAAGAQVQFEELRDREHLVSDQAVAGLRGLLTAG